jgi:hypothetical protein
MTRSPGPGRVGLGQACQAGPVEPAAAARLKVEVAEDLSHGHESRSRTVTDLTVASAAAGRDAGGGSA